MADGPKYIVSVDFDVGDLQSKVSAKLAGLETKRIGKLDVNAAGEVSGLTSKLEALGKSAGDALGRVGEAFTGAVERAGELALHLGMLAGAAAVGAVTYGVVELNQELEQANLSLAAVFKAEGYATDFAGAMTIATDQVEKMKIDVKQLPGTFMQLAGIMQSMAIPAAQAGLTPDKIRELSEQTALFAGITGIRPEDAGGGMAQLLGGQARKTSPMARLLGFTGDKATKLRSESGEERYKDIEKAISKYDAAREAFSHTWKAVSTTVKDDILLSLLAPATSPLFESVKATLVNIHGWFETNKGGIDSFTYRLGQGLKEAWEWGEKTFQKWMPAITTFASDAYNEIAGIWRKVEPTISKVSESIRGALGDGSALKTIENILKLYAVVKVGGMLPLGSIGGALGKGIGGLLGGGAEAVEGATAAEGAAGAGMLAGGPFAIAGIVALGAAAWAAAGEVKALADPNSPYHRQAVDAASSLGHELGQASAYLHGHTKGAGSEWERAGVQLTEATAKFVHGYNEVIGYLQRADTWLEEADLLGFLKLPPHPKMVGDEPEGDTPEERALARERANYRLRFARGVTDKESPWSEGVYYGKAQADQKDKLGKPGNSDIKPGAGGGAGVNIGTQVNNFTVSTTSEPSRVARSIKNAIAEKSRNPTSDPTVPNFSAAPVALGY